MTGTVGSRDEILPRTVEGFIRPRRSNYGQFVSGSAQIGALAGGYCYLLTPAFNLIWFTPLGLVPSLVIGTVMGLIAGLFVGGMLSKRDYPRVKPFLCYLTIPLTIGCGLLDGVGGATVLIGPAILIGLSIIALLIWPRRGYGEGRCEYCGYDLRGLPAPVRCPECGGAEPACWFRKRGPADERFSWIAGLAAIACRRPILTTAIFLVLVAIPPTFRDLRHLKRKSELEAAMAQAARMRQHLSLGEVFDYDWDTAHVFDVLSGPNPSVQKNWRDFERAMPFIPDDDQTVLVLLKDRSPREFFILRGGIVGAPDFFPRNQAVFEVEGPGPFFPLHWRPPGLMAPIKYY